MNKLLIISSLILGISLEIQGTNFSQFPIHYPSESRVINGRKAGLSELPYQVRLFHPPFLCGGSFIKVNGKHLVVTAAHCVSDDINPKNYQVVAGNIYRDRRQSTEQNLQVTKIVVHKDYNKEAHLNDIALLSMEKPFRINGYVSPISLPEQKQIPGMTGVVSGWGKIQDKGPSSYTLLTATIKIWPDSYCSSLYPGIYNPSLMICAGSYRGSCQGDSGGPLVDQKTNKLVGIVSFGEGSCTKPNQPGFYVRASSYVDWIRQQAFYL